MSCSLLHRPSTASRHCVRHPSRLSPVEALQREVRMYQYEKSPIPFPGRSALAIKRVALEAADVRRPPARLTWRQLPGPNVNSPSRARPPQRLGDAKRRILARIVRLNGGTEGAPKCAASSRSWVTRCTRPSPPCPS